VNKTPFSACPEVKFIKVFVKPGRAHQFLRWFGSAQARKTSSLDALTILELTISQSGVVEISVIVCDVIVYLLTISLIQIGAKGRGTSLKMDNPGICLSFQ